MDRVADHHAYFKQDIAECLQEMQCAPILFVGSGFSQRYFGAPTWVSLLEQLANACPNIEYPLAYYRQSHPNDLPAVAEEFVQLYQQWAWSGAGKGDFAPELFGSEEPSSIFLKATCAKQIDTICPSSIQDVEKAAMREELRAFIKIRPNCLITTNYDRFLESILPGYRAVIGEQLIRSDINSIGDVYKIHGCVSDPKSIVLTTADYDNYVRKRKYLSAKLLTYFLEFPVFFFGYGINDTNIQGLLSDIDEILTPEGKVIPNIYFVRWVSEENPQEVSQIEVPINVGGGKHIRLKQISTSSFTWLFECLSQHSPMQVRVDVLRRVLSRATRIIRKDILSGAVEVNFKTIEALDSDSSDKLQSVFGVARIDDPKQINLNFPYTLTQVGKALGYGTWHKADEFIKLAATKHGHDIKSSDNNYHVLIKTGERGAAHKYSLAAVDLLRAIRDDQPHTFILQG